MNKHRYKDDEELVNRADNGFVPGESELSQNFKMSYHWHRTNVIWILLLEIFILSVEVQKFLKIGITYIFNSTQIVLSILEFSEIVFFHIPHRKTLKEEG